MDGSYWSSDSCRPVSHGLAPKAHPYITVIKAIPVNTYLFIYLQTSSNLHGIYFPEVKGFASSADHIETLTRIPSLTETFPAPITISSPFNPSMIST